MVKFTVKVHTHRCEECLIPIQCDQSLLHVRRCNDCFSVLTDKLLFGA